MKPAPKTVQAIRDGIKCKELIDLVQDNTLKRGGKPLNPQKLQQIKLLLAKAMPDIKVQEITGQVDSKVTISWEGDD